MERDEATQCPAQFAVVFQGVRVAEHPAGERADGRFRGTATDGNALNVVRTVQSYEQAGVAGLHLED